MASPDLVIGYHKLDTKFFTGHVQHTTFHSDTSQGRRRVKEVRDWYRDREIGRGTFGTVFLERSERGEYRAVKEIAKDKDGTRKIDYRRELMAMAILAKHDALFVQLFGWYESDDYVHIAMEYFSHGHLRKYLEVERSEGEAKVITRQLLEGLVIIHQEGFAHRDLKPENIFVVSASPVWVKIGDFGLAKLARDGTAFRTEGGTRDYIAPEAGADTSRETSEYTNAVDIWAIGCIAHEMLARVLPFQNFFELSLYCTRREFPRNYMLSKNISRKGMDIVESMLALPPERRITAKEALDSEWLRLDEVHGGWETEDWQEGLETGDSAGLALPGVPTPSGAEAVVPCGERNTFRKRLTDVLWGRGELAGPSDRNQAPISTSPAVKNEGGNQNGFISTHTNLKDARANLWMTITSRWQTKYPAVIGPYYSQGSRVSAVGGGTKDTTPLRPGADNTRDLSSTEIFLLPDCPKGNPVPSGLWFQVPNLLGFDVCSKCYYTHIHRSPFKSKFSLVVDRAEGIVVGCGFSTPRILLLWEAALQERNFEPFLRYAEARIPHYVMLRPFIRERWWVVQGDMPNFQVCGACYYDLVLASPFATRFTPLVTPRDGIYCGLRIQGLQKRFLRLIESHSPVHGNTWRDFVQSANHRIAGVPECAGTASVYGPRVWWTCKVIPGFAICEACYLDEVEPSPWHDMFTPISDKLSLSDKRSCDFAILPVKLSWQLALNDVARDFDGFWKRVEAVIANAALQWASNWWRGMVQDVKRWQL